MHSLSSFIRFLLVKKKQNMASYIRFGAYFFVDFFGYNLVYKQYDKKLSVFFIL
jgi:hypothetical protein